MTYKLCQNANFENGGTTTQSSTLHVLLNIFVNIFTVKGTCYVWLFRDAKRVVISFYVLKKINKMLVAC